jgi:hypothetical protein
MMNGVRRKTTLTRRWLEKISNNAFSLLKQQALIVHDTSVAMIAGRFQEQIGKQ